MQKVCGLIPCWFPRTVWLCLYTLFYWAAQAQGSSEAFLNKDAILEGWKAGYGSIHSMRVAYSETVANTEVTGDNAGALDNLVHNQHVERTERGRCFVIEYSTGKEPFSDPEAAYINSFDGTSNREWWGHKVWEQNILTQTTGKDYRGTRPYATITQGLKGRHLEELNALKRHMFMDVPPSLIREKQNIDQKFLDMPQFQRIVQSPFAVVKAGIETVGKLQEECHVVEVIHQGRLYHRMYVSHDKGMLPIKYERYDGKGNLLVDMEALELSQSAATVGSVWYPSRARRIVHNPKAGTTVEYQLVAREFIPNIDIDADTFTFPFPQGTEVFDKIHNLHYVVGLDEDHAPDLDGLGNNEVLGKTEIALPVDGSVTTSSSEIGPAEGGRENTSVLTEGSGHTGKGSKPIIYILAVVFLGILLWYSIRLRQNRKSARR